MDSVLHTVTFAKLDLFPVGELLLFTAVLTVAGGWVAQGAARIRAKRSHVSFAGLKHRDVRGAIADFITPTVMLVLGYAIAVVLGIVGATVT